MSSRLLKLEQQACELPLKQQKLLISFLEDHHNSQFSLNMLTNNFIAKPQCPHCKASHISDMGNQMADNDIVVIIAVKPLYAP